MAEYQENIEDPKSTTVVGEKFGDDAFVKASDILDEAKAQTAREHAMSLREGIRKYPKAVGWSILFSVALIMEGFDHSFISGFMAFPAFQKRYGKLTANGTYQIPATLQSAIGNGVSAGEIVGLLLNGYFADIVGYRWVMISCLIMIIGFVFLQFFATSIEMYLGAEILLGLPW
jgi:MFS transporter, SP family, general alpha glucoside:H+ symporter